MKNRFKKLLLLLLITIISIPITIKAEGTVDEIRITSDTINVTEGELTAFTVSTTTEHITIEDYGSNTSWSKWGENYSSWHGFGTETPTAEADDITHYALRLAISLEEGYTFGDSPVIYFNGDNITNLGHTMLDTGFDWGGYLYIDLGTAIEEQDPNEQDPNEPQKITSVNVTIRAPKIGTEVKMIEVQGEYGSYQTPDLLPTVILESGANYEYDGGYYITALPSMLPDGYDEPFIGTFEKDIFYYMEVYIIPKEGYEFDENVTLKVNGQTDNYELNEWNHFGQLMFYTKIKAGDEDPKVIEGANQIFDKNGTKKLTFKFDIPFAEFSESGKVYIDGKLVEKSNYSISEGSTIITFNTAYTNTLSTGNHTIRVTSNNNDITTAFTVNSNPNTGDNILISILTLITSIFALSILLNYKKKNI